ncbi:MAG TPA: heavy-metal-associated domain-containing protein [Plantibacter sp.]|uniref:heavy-metal-associated domain-containing protein n=1 Tax=unclassified Plantibacter TaxID=2624265 RepID=UPI002D11A122|nr:heavy-metal-associated domain-containing protein [Plantibacter sp.]
MRTGARLAVYGLGLAVAFGGAMAIARAVVPATVVAEWTEGAETSGHTDGHSGTSDEPTWATADVAASEAAAPRGLSLGSDGFVLSVVEAPGTVGQAGELRFQIQTHSGEPVTDYTTAHDKDLHLIVVRSDGSGFRHAHPTLDQAAGTWSLPWTWEAAGSYRVFADFTTADPEPVALTLTRTVEVAGEVTPVVPKPVAVSQVDGFEVSLEGDLSAGSSSELTITVSRDGKQVSTLEPYLGAFGHLVALREGDLAFLHVHADGDEPESGETSGPAITFFAAAPTAGRYLLYLDFQVDGQVHTAEFVLDASHDSSDTSSSDPTSSPGPADTTDSDGGSHSEH